MLVVTRKAGEEILIDQHIYITVVAIQGDKVRLGITAPPDVPVDRAETLGEDRRPMRDVSGYILNIP
jgi:carbon storage regulator